ncbi:thioredoxin [Mangrovimonas sp. AS39]|uniref:thioredoxin n=1 Tax=Mangrovimonas TaxID=1211036 RepID=UPI0006B4CE29|nr:MULTISPECIES: thioredoxin [Mangrovimonas]MCF1191508.1 thioredoxin [Mangrovimonas futianensis]MCF1195203.1 thioredoxin [Mangrovimonas futianensis]MCF1421118.1 thioredoxin [Mangrovimonas futianensis]NIK92255.1 thioredoxin [Mangrovimonas sp. CR14]
MAKFSEIVASSQPTLVDFYADWCGPCKMMAPILEQVKESLGDKVRIIKIDVDKNQALSAKYAIRSIPTLMLFKQGEILWKQPGVLQERDLTQKILTSI